jgi:hypothetical protein
MKQNKLVKYIEKRYQFKMGKMINKYNKVFKENKIKIINKILSKNTLIN